LQDSLRVRLVHLAPRAASTSLALSCGSLAETQFIRLMETIPVRSRSAELTVVAWRSYCATAELSTDSGRPEDVLHEKMSET